MDSRGSRCGDHADPRRERIQNFVHDLAVIAARARRHVKGMIGGFDTMQRRRWPKALDQGFQQLQLRKTVAGALHKKHRHMDIGEVVALRQRFPDLPLVLTHVGFDVDGGGIAHVRVPADFETLVV